MTKAMVSLSPAGSGAGACRVCSDQPRVRRPARRLRSGGTERFPATPTATAGGTWERTTSPRPVTAWWKNSAGNSCHEQLTFSPFKGTEEWEHMREVYVRYATVGEQGTPDRVRATSILELGTHCLQRRMLCRSVWGRVSPWIAVCRSRRGGRVVGIIRIQLNRLDTLF